MGRAVVVVVVVVVVGIIGKGKVGCIRSGCAWLRRSSPSHKPFEPVVGKNPLPLDTGLV